MKHHNKLPGNGKNRLRSHLFLENNKGFESLLLKESDRELYIF